MSIEHIGVLLLLIVFVSIASGQGSNIIAFAGAEVAGKLNMVVLGGAMYHVSTLLCSGLSPCRSCLNDL